MTINKKQSFHDDTNRYEAWFKKNNHLFDSEVMAIQELMETKKKNLEIGIGTGLFAERLGIREGVEPLEVMSQIAIERGIEIHKGMAEALPLPDQSYEQVFMITADCFLQNLPGALKEVHRILVDGGIFIIAFLDRSTFLGAIYEEKKATDPFYKNAHFRSSEEMKSLLIGSGFSVEEERQTIFTMDNRLQPSKKGLGKGVFAVVKTRKETL